MLDYTELYCKLDCILLCSIFEQYRKSIYTEFQLDAAQFLGTPSLAYTCMLSTLSDDVELITDPSMISMIVDGGIRGGLSVVNTRHEIVDEKPDAQEGLVYLDVNSLYGSVETLPMPCQEYEWLSPDLFTQADIDKWSFESEHGFILEVDVSIRIKRQ